jgi:DNA repair exonuclease SbcCD ATPase subunit
MIKQSKDREYKEFFMDAWKHKNPGKIKKLQTGEIESPWAKTKKEEKEIQEKEQLDERLRVAQRIREEADKSFLQLQRQEAQFKISTEKKRVKLAKEKEMVERELEKAREYRQKIKELGREKLKQEKAKLQGKVMADIKKKLGV